ncbi:MAG: hypothetical protein ACLGG7_06990 [Bacteriovoracia bacterium]
MDDYLQPDFFRFGWDQFFLIDTVVELVAGAAPETLIELGAGSGVIACELSRKLPLKTVHFVEFQQTEWEPFLSANVARFCTTAAPVFHWTSVSQFNLEGEVKVPLVVANPPYFLPETGRKALDPRRNIARRFVVDPWQAWVDAMVRSLAPGGEAYWLHRDPGPMGRPVFPEDFSWHHVKRSGRMRIICLRRSARG